MRAPRPAAAPGAPAMLPGLPGLLGLLGLLGLALSACSPAGNETTLELSPTPFDTVVEPSPVGASPGSSPPPAGSGRDGVLETVASDLDVPWGLAFFPNGDALVTERDTTRLLRVSGPQRVVQEVGTLTDATPGAGAGLLDVAIAPSYPDDRSVYLYLTTAADNRIVRASLEEGVLGTPEVLLAGIPRGYDRNGGRLAFGPDGALYAATGDAGQPALAADPSSLAGKVLRLDPADPPDPADPAALEATVWAQGLRDPLGLAFDDEDRLWVTDSGEDEVDELSSVEAGDDLGWPAVEGEGERADRGLGYTAPELTWPLAEAGPGGLAFADGRLWVGALDGERLWEVPVDDPGSASVALRGQGRLRTVGAAPDGTLWVTTSQTEPGGEPAAGDDRVLRLRP